MISNCAKYLKPPESLRRPIATCMGWRPPSQSCVVSRALTSSSQELLHNLYQICYEASDGSVYKSISIVGMPCIIKRPFFKLITLQYMYNSFSAPSLWRRQTNGQPPSTLLLLIRALKLDIHVPGI